MLFKVLMKNFRCQLKMCEGVQNFYEIVLRVQEENVCRPLLYPACLARHSRRGDWTSFCRPAVFHSFSITLGSRIQKLGSRASFRVPSPRLLPGDWFPHSQETSHTKAFILHVFSHYHVQSPLERDQWFLWLDPKSLAAGRESYLFMSLGIKHNSGLDYCFEERKNAFISLRSVTFIPPHKGWI